MLSGRWRPREHRGDTYFIAGRSDWGTYQSPGALDAMALACSSFAGPYFIDEAGHWVQQEQPQSLDVTLGRFLALHAL